jgi:hypothetical protein
VSHGRRTIDDPHRAHGFGRFGPRRPIGPSVCRKRAPARKEPRLTPSTAPIRARRTASNDGATTPSPLAEYRRWRGRQSTDRDHAGCGTVPYNLPARHDPQRLLRTFPRYVGGPIRSHVFNS